MENKIHLSVVSPVYGCNTVLIELYTRLKDTLTQITENFEIIFVNDASPDNAWETIVELSEKDNRVKGINFSRNFGQHYAITAGLDYCSGEWVVVMDCDLQDQPEEILKLYAKVQEGFDIVLARRVNRKDSFFKKLSNKLFYSAFYYLTNSKLDNTVASFRIVKKKVVESYKSLNEYHRFINLTMAWLGFKVAYVSIEHAQRTLGKSSYNLKKLINLTINAMVSFSDKPLKLTIKFGFLLVILSSIFIFYKIIITLHNGTNILGWSSLIASIFFSTGIIVSTLGIIGLYIGRIFEEVKKRPLYIINELININ